jgi:hypothetical protein
MASTTLRVGGRPFSALVCRYTSGVDEELDSPPVLTFKDSFSASGICFFYNLLEEVVTNENNVTPHMATLPIHIIAFTHEHRCGARSMRGDSDLGDKARGETSRYRFIGERGE